LRAALAVGAASQPASKFNFYQIEWSCGGREAENCCIYLNIQRNRVVPRRPNDPAALHAEQ